MVGCFSRAKSVNELWNMIKTRQHRIHTFTNKELDEINAKNRNDPYYVPKCGVLSNIDKFDAKFFKISYQEATLMDPQQRLLLGKSIQALDEAGINPQYEKGQIGVFVAIEKSTYKNYSYNNENNLAKKYSEELNTSSGSVATRIVYHLNLKGPAFSLNSTCSSLLTALKTAWNSIQCGDLRCGYSRNNKIDYTASSVDGQYNVIKKAFQSAKLLSDDISFIEAYGTATKLGDIVEIKALTQIFIELLPTTTKHCAISSVKSNIGYCNTAAGFTGLIKTVKALEDHVIFLMAKDYFEKANLLINFLYSPFYIASKLQNFNKTEVMCAGVSSFAKSINSLNNIKREFKNYFKSYDLTISNLYNLCNIARTLQMGRAQYEFRNMIIATTISDVLIQLEQTKSTIHVISSKENIIFIVPSQGSHSISIHQHIYKSSTLYQKKFKECVDIMQKYDSTVPDLISYLEKDVYDTTYNPLLIFISNYISAEILRLVFNIQISGIVGHSLGQYVAATLARIFPLDIALAIVLKRTQIMQKIENGSMLATNLHSKLANNFIKVGKFSLAAINKQNQCIFSGRPKDIEKLAVILETQNYKVKMLNVRYRFHSHLTDSILDEFEIEISSLLIEASKQPTSMIIPFISNATGCKLVQRILNNNNITILNCFDSDKTNFKEIIGNCWCNGIEINWHNYNKYISPFITKTQLIRLPGYSFNHTCSYWVQQTHQKSLVKTNTNDFVSSKFDQQPLVSTMQDRVILCFKKTLGLNYINSNFFDCGANSIKEILSENIPHTINSNFNRPTSITKLNHGCETVKPIYMIHSVSGSCIFYRDIISSLENFTVYGNTYNLFGSSFGGIVAYEMGCKLVKHGKSVNLIMVDTPTGQDMTNSTISVAEILRYTFSKTYKLDELIGINDDEKALQMAIEKVSALGMKQDQEIIPDNSVITTLKRNFDVIKFSMKAMKTYQLPRSEKPIPIIYFKAKTRKNLDIEFPEKSWNLCRTDPE
ncbi:polyketide synthase [Gigaspora margarita]|uniref:Polyketide synthase n=1 Tax=Gigaspora margarita TaxID=4874 RepID=A0A8H4AFQ4_GIGMA|nr:polyketide synthase [Gigaspora margarita]